MFVFEVKGVWKILQFLLVKESNAVTSFHYEIVEKSQLKHIKDKISSNRMGFFQINYNFEVNTQNLYNVNNILLCISYILFP